MAYEDFENLPRRTASNKVLHDEVFNVAKNQKYDGYKCVLASVVYKFLIRSSLYSQTNLLPVELLKIKIC